MTEATATGPKYLPQLLLEPDELCILVSEVFELYILLTELGTLVCELGTLVCKLATKYMSKISYNSDMFHGITIQFIN